MCGDSAICLHMFVQRNGMECNFSNTGFVKFCQGSQMRHCKIVIDRVI